MAANANGLHRHLAGLTAAPVGILALLLSPVIGKLLPRLDARAIASVSFVVLATVSFMRAGFTHWRRQLHRDAAANRAGRRHGHAVLPLTAILLSGLHPSRIPAASGLSNFCRITAGAFGASIATTVGKTAPPCTTRNWSSRSRRFIRQPRKRATA